MKRQKLFGFAVAAENVDDFVTIEFLHVVAGRAEVFAGVELTGLLSEDAANSCCHGETAVGVDVNFADCALGGFAELLFGNTDCIGKLAAELVDGVDFFLRNR